MFQRQAEKVISLAHGTLHPAGDEIGYRAKHFYVPGWKMFHPDGDLKTCKPGLGRGRQSGPVQIPIQNLKKLILVSISIPDFSKFNSCPYLTFFKIQSQFLSKSKIFSIQSKIFNQILQNSWYSYPRNIRIKSSLIKTI